MGTSQSGDAMRRWAVCPNRPTDWLHHSAYRRERFSAIGRLFEQTDEFLQPQPVIGWLEALVNNAEAADAVWASAAAIQAAALLPPDLRQGIDGAQVVFGMAGEWLPLDPERVFLSDPAPAIGAKLNPRTSVHPDLLADDDTLTARRYAGDCEDVYRQEPLPRTPQSGMLGFFRSDGAGPLSLIRRLSDEGRVLWTSSLMAVESIYGPYEYGHRGANGHQYPVVSFKSPALHQVRHWGLVATTTGVAPVSAALGANPEDHAALEALYRHTNVAEIKEALDLADPAPTTFGEQAPVPLTDMWPGVAAHLAAGDADVQLVRCDQILAAGKRRSCAYRQPNVFLAGDEDDDEYSELQLVSREMDLDLTGRQIVDIVDGTTAVEVEQRRKAIRDCSSDAERVLAAVGAAALRGGLPASLVRIVEQSQPGPETVPIAIGESAIANVGFPRNLGGML